MAKTDFSIEIENNSSVHYDAVILGAGISGLVSASILAQQGYSRILVVDEYKRVGGNHIDCVFGDYTFDVGSFIFQDDSPLLRHFPELLALYVPIKPKTGRLNPQGVVARYPISVEDDLLSAGPVELSRIIFSVLYARLFQREQTDARSFARYWIGARLLERTGLEHYMKRFYGVPADEIDIGFAKKRMLWIKNNASLATYTHRRLKRAIKGPSNQQLARPQEGFETLYRAATSKLEQRGVTFLLGAKMSNLEKRGNTFHLRAGHDRLTAGRLVSTIPIPKLQELCGIVSGENLRTVTLISLFFSFSGVRGFDQSILFNFSHEGAWKRLTMHSDFYGLCGGREFFCVEINADHVRNSVEVAEHDFRQHTAANGLFMGDLKCEGSHVLEAAYPVYTDHASERAEKALIEIRALGIESFGRQGGFDYQPTARVSTTTAEAALRRD